MPPAQAPVQISRACECGSVAALNPRQWAYHHIFNKPPGSRTVLPIGQSILFGLVFFAILCGIPIAFGFVSYGAGMGALVVLAMAGLSFGYRSGMLAVLGATFVALLPILGFLVWLLGFLVWRAIKPAKAVARAK